MGQFRIKFLEYGLACFCALAAGVLHAEPAAQNLRLVTDTATSIEGAVFKHQHAVSYASPSKGALVDLASLGVPAYVAIDAFSVVGTQLLFSTEVAFSHSGTTYRDEDVIRMPMGGSTLSSLLDGSAIGIPVSADLDALSGGSSAGTYLFSLDIPANLPDIGGVRDNDVVRYTGSAFELAFDGDGVLGIPDACDLDALHLAADGTLYFSLSRTASISGHTGDDAAVWKHKSGVTSLAFAGSVLSGGADLVGLDDLLDTDGDGLSDLEELSGVDEPGTGVGGSPLSPGGVLTDPSLADSDRDGADDGAEAGAGTDPHDGSERLAITHVAYLGASNVVHWSSVPGQSYRVNASFNPALGFAPLVQGLSSGSATNMSHTHVLAATNRVFYRVGAEL